MCVLITYRVQNSGAQWLIGFGSPLRTSEVHFHPQQVTTMAIKTTLRFIGSVAPPYPSSTFSWQILCSLNIGPFRFVPLFVKTPFLRRSLLLSGKANVFLETSDYLNDFHFHVIRSAVLLYTKSFMWNTQTSNRVRFFFMFNRKVFALYLAFDNLPLPTLTHVGSRAKQASWTCNVITAGSSRAGHVAS